MMRWRVVAKGLFAGSCFVSMAAACNPNGCTPTDNPTLGNLTFTTQAGTLTEFTIPGVPNDAWGQGVLANSRGPNPVIYLGYPGESGGSPYVTTIYQSAPPPPQFFRQEVNVFVRDLHEYASTLFGLNDNNGWQPLLSACDLPPSVKLLYPTITGVPASQDPTTYANFFGGCDGSPAPSLTSEFGPWIHAAIMNDHGVCAASINPLGGVAGSAGGIFPMIQQAAWDEFVGGVQAQGDSCADAEQQWWYSAEYIDENPNLAPDIAPRGGFVVNFSWDTPLEFGSLPQTAINFSYAWGLTDGILSVTPTEHQTSISDSSRASSLRYNLVQGMQNAVPGGIFAATQSAQSVDPFPKTNAGRSNCTPATATGTDCPNNQPKCPDSCCPNGWICVSDGSGNLSCAQQAPVPYQEEGALKEQTQLLGELGIAATDGTFQALGLNPDPKVKNLAGMSALDVLQAPINERDPANAKVYHNWVCALNCPSWDPSCATAQGQGVNGFYRYEIVIRARRLNYYPDTVELVWTDDLQNEVGPQTNVTTVNSGASTYVALYDLARKSGSPPTSAWATFSVLCNTVPAAPSRAFAVYNAGPLYQSMSDLQNCLLNGSVENNLLPWNLPSTLQAIAGSVGSDISGAFSGISF